MAIDNQAMNKLTYGLFVLTTKDGNKQNGCIVNTVSMITSNPRRITVYVNKSNYTEELLRKTGVFNVSVLDESAPFSVFQRFGFSSGRDTDKFAGTSCSVTENGLYYLPEHANAVLSAKVIDALDYGTHTLFVAEVTEAKVLSDAKSMTYEYYFASVKPKPQAAKTDGKEPEAKAEKKLRRFVCKICGYVYEGESLPADFVCPLCKHGAEDFEEI